jgi:rod shape-determining protein MreD
MLALSGSSRTGALALGLLDAGRIAALLAVAVLLQVTIGRDLGVAGGRPDLVVLIVVATAMARGPAAGAATGFAGGIGVDALGLGVVGITSLTLVGIGFIVGVYGERVPTAAALRPLLIVAVAALAAATGELAVAVLVGTGPSLSAASFLVAVPAAMLDVLIAIPAYPLIRRLLARRRRGVA